MNDELRIGRALRDVAEKAVRTHFEIDTSAAREVSDPSSEVYRTSRAFMLAALTSAYPDADPEAVYAAYVDLAESLTYCVRAVRQDLLPATPGLTADDTGPLDGLPIA